MNEQLVVKNFGPIKDATVDFKRVTVFIGPTGGGKSTLAKLAAIFRKGEVIEDEKISIQSQLKEWSLKSFEESLSEVTWDNKVLPAIAIGLNSFEGNEKYLKELKAHSEEWIKDNHDSVMNLLHDAVKKLSVPEELVSMAIEYAKKGLAVSLTSGAFKKVLSNDIVVCYIPAERVFVAAIEYSWAGLISEGIGLSKALLEFANSFSTSRKEVMRLEMPFLNANYQHIGGRDFIKIPDREEPLILLETASGIQSVTPLLVLLEHLSRNTEQAQSFIIEEPELNLYPTAQQGLLNWLVEKCTKGENDLTITTHSPYLLAHFNLLLYAYQVAENHPERAEDVAKIVPRESWINPKEFAAYHVEGQQENGVRTIINPETGLISYNQLDALAGLNAEEFDKLLDISAGLEVA